MREFVGYGVGERAIQEPQLPCFGVAGRGARLEADMVLHVHAIAAAGRFEVDVRSDQWTAVTRDGRPAALCTALVRVGADRCDVLTPLLA